jgi:phosphatidylglycerophosphate synthase
LFAAIVVVLSLLGDILDGLLARWLKAVSPLGARLYR